LFFKNDVATDMNLLVDRVIYPISFALIVITQKEAFLGFVFQLGTGFLGDVYVACRTKNTQVIYSWFGFVV
jgi:hypothetical protein